jgi:hypothetical protein
MRMEEKVPPGCSMYSGVIVTAVIMGESCCLRMCSWLTVCFSSCCCFASPSLLICSVSLIVVVDFVLPCIRDIEEHSPSLFPHKFVEIPRCCFVGPEKTCPTASSHFQDQPLCCSCGESETPPHVLPKAVSNSHGTGPSVCLLGARRD